MIGMIEKVLKSLRLPIIYCGQSEEWPNDTWYLNADTSATYYLLDDEEGNAKLVKVYKDDNDASKEYTKILFAVPMEFDLVRTMIASLVPISISRHDNFVSRNNPCSEHNANGIMMA
jgi:hypothetical protein